MEEEKIHAGVEVQELKSWREFLKWIEQRHANSPALIYRGQANALWKVESTLDRLERRFSRTRNDAGSVPEHFDCPPASRETHLHAFQLAVRNRRGVNPPLLKEDEWWALGQHHGLATPMLDWTLSPFVALFFAFEPEKCGHDDGQYREPENRAVFALSSSCITEHHTQKDPAPLPYTPGGETSYRIGNQAGVLLMMPRATDLESYVRGHFQADTSCPDSHPRAILQKFIIRNKEEDRIDCLKLLNKMNINRMSLFPDIDGAAQYINALWELDFDTSLGQLPMTLPCDKAGNEKRDESNH